MPNYREGDEVYLIPNTPTAPTAAYKQPLVTVKSATSARAVVVLADGTELTTDTRNLAFRRREDPSKNMKIRPKLLPGFEEQPMW